MSGLNTTRDRDPTALGRNFATLALDATIPEDTKSVIFDADGVCTVTNMDGTTNVADIPVIKGQPLAAVPLKITAMTGPTAIWRTY